MRDWEGICKGFKEVVMDLMSVEFIKIFVENSRKSMRLGMVIREVLGGWKYKRSWACKI